MPLPNSSTWSTVKISIQMPVSTLLSTSHHSTLRDSIIGRLEDQQQRSLEEFTAAIPSRSSTSNHRTVSRPNEQESSWYSSSISRRSDADSAAARRSDPDSRTHACDGCAAEEIELVASRNSSGSVTDAPTLEDDSLTPDPPDVAPSAAVVGPPAGALRCIATSAAATESSVTSSSGRKVRF